MANVDVAGSGCGRKWAWSWRGGHVAIGLQAWHLPMVWPRMGGAGYVHGGCVSPRGRGRKWAWPEVGAALPECRPMRMRTGTSGMWRILKVPTELRMSSDMLAISPACRLPLRFGSPEATM